MKSIWVFALLVGCQSNESSPPAPAAKGRAASGPPAKVDAAYTQDIEAVCDVVARAGQGKMPDAVTVATWTAQTLQTQDARLFLAKIQPLVGNAKADALDQEATRVGLSKCALSQLWREAPAATP